MKDSQTFRRKNRQVIADSKSERDANRAAQSQEQLLGGIHDKLDDVQTATDLTSDTVENKSNQVIDSLNKGFGDVQASSELTAEAVEAGNGEFRKLNDIASQISDKLSKLTTALENKLSPQTQSTPSNATSSSSTALAVISEAIPDIQTDQERITQAIEDLLPKLEYQGPDADFADEPKQEPVPVVVNPSPNNPANEQDEEEKKKNGKSLSEKIGALLKVTKDGFKSSIGFSDKIAGMLFKYTVTAAIEAAKMAAMLLSLVLGIDVIRINFNYWSELLKTNFAQFSERLGKWAPLFKDIIDSVDEVKAAWEKGDWSGITIAIVKGVGKAIYNLTEMIVLGISKLISAVIRLFPGGEERANALEADSLRTYQDHTGAKLTDDESKLVAEDDITQMKKSTRVVDQNNKQQVVDDQKVKYGAMSQEDYDKKYPQAKKDNDEFFSKPKDQQIAIIQARNEAQAAIKRTSEYIDSGDGSDKFKNSAKGAIEDISKRINSDDISNAPNIKADLQNQLDILNKKYDALVSKPSVKADSPKESEEVKTIERINSQKAAQSNNSAPSGTYTQVNNRVSKSTNQFTLPTQTATVAPGLFGHTSQVN